MNISDEKEQHLRFMAEAIKLAEANLTGIKGGPFGAVVVKEGKVIGKGSNMVTDSNDPTAHAEIVAIRDACQQLNDFQLTGCDIYCSCEPCPMCLGAIYWARPARVFFAATREDAANAGFDDAFIYEELTVDLFHRKIETHQLLQNDARSVLQKWAALDRKIPY